MVGKKLTRDEEQKLKNYTDSFSFGDFTFLGLISDGEQGLVTGNNSRYVSVIADSDEEARIRLEFASRLSEISGHSITSEEIKDNQEYYYKLAEEHKRKLSKPSLFGKFFLYRTVKKKEVKFYQDLTEKEIKFGCENETWVYYNRGNESGFKWFVPPAEAILWSVKSVRELKEGTETNSRWQGSDYFSSTGFGWVDYFTERIKSFFIPQGPYSKNIVKFHTGILTDKFIVAILNSAFITYYVKNFITATHTLQINDGRLIPIKIPTKALRIEIESIVNYLLFLKSQTLPNPTAQLMPAYFEKLIDGMVYELYFPELFGAHNCEIIKHLGTLPEFTDGMSNETKMGLITEVFLRLNGEGSLVKINLERMMEIEEVRVIEGGR